LYFFLEDFATNVEFNDVFHGFVCILEKIGNFIAVDDLCPVCSEIEEKSGFCFSGGLGSQ
jgi:hypothetical protein